MNTYPSRLLEEAVNELTKLPGIGKRTALRLALWLLKQDPSRTHLLGNAIINLRDNISYCKICHNISDQEVCNICADTKRDSRIVCIVEDVRDVMAIENTNQYRGVYHILGGVISPIEGVGPQDINLESLVQKAMDGNLSEVIMALPSTTEGDTTAYYIYRKISTNVPVISSISRGIAIGDDLEYTDEVTLGKSIRNRVPFDTTI
ncbi:MAG TPA: recombination mediator RecR [Lentimicrobium sp.]|nr:recombination mediator RecR [Lentimicrobium sp.]